MIRPPFRPPLFHEPGTSTEATAKPASKAGCCNRADCCGRAAAKRAESNSQALNSVAPARTSAPVGGAAAGTPVHRAPGC